MDQWSTSSGGQHGHKLHWQGFQGPPIFLVVNINLTELQLNVNNYTKTKLKVPIMCTTLHWGTEKVFTETVIY